MPEGCREYLAKPPAPESGNVGLSTALRRLPLLLLDLADEGSLSLPRAGGRIRAQRRIGKRARMATAPLHWQREGRS